MKRKITWKLLAWASAVCLAIIPVAGCKNQENQSPVDSETSAPISTPAVEQGYYVLEKKTVGGKDVTPTVVCSYLRLERGKASLYSADFSGAELQEGTYLQTNDQIDFVLNSQMYAYTYNAEAGTLTFSGKVNRREELHIFRFDRSYTPPDVTGTGVPFVSDTELFGESLDENFYNYCPTVMMEGNSTMHVWYCANQTSGNITDYIAYRKGTLNNAGQWTFTEKQIVLEPTAGTWDARHTCDPSVVKGIFTLGGEGYSYLMAYLGCKTSDNTQNEVGIAVAKAPEGPWIKVNQLNPIANFYTSDEYNNKSWGYGQPCVISSDQAGKILLFYSKGIPTGTFTYLEEWNLSDLDHPQKLRETRLSNRGVINSKGEQDVINNADFAYDPHLKRLYCIKEDFGYPTDGGVNWITGSNTLLYMNLDENGFDALFDTFTWKVCGQLTKTMTGYSRNHNMGIMTNEYGELCNPYKIPILYTVSDSLTDHPNWSAAGQWPALHTYRLHGWVFSVR